MKSKRLWWLGSSVLLGNLLILAAWFVGCDLGGRWEEEAWREEERIYDEQEELGEMEESLQVGWSDHGRSTGGFDAAPSWEAKLVLKSASLEGRPDPRTPREDGEREEPEPYVWSYGLDYGNVILSPTGESLLAMVPVPGPDEGFDEAGLALVQKPLPDGPAQVYPGIRNVQRINFSPDGRWAYLLGTEGTSVTVVDLFDYQVVSTFPLDGVYSVIDVSPDGMYVVVSNLPRSVSEEKSYPSLSGCIPPASYDMVAGSDLCRIGVVWLQQGHSWSFAAPEPVRDVDFMVQTSQLVVTHKATDDALETNHAVVQFYDLKAQAAGTKLVFPNCADELKVLPGEQTALLSPTYCASVGAKDPGSSWAVLDEGSVLVPVPVRSCEPISFIDLESRTFIENLPGFGPVAVTPDGKKALGFTRKKLLEEQWDYYGQNTDYGLVLADVPTRTWKVVDFGASIPSYFISPKGRTALVHNYIHRCRCTRKMNGGECDNSAYEDCKSTCCTTCCEELHESNLYQLDLYSGSLGPISIPLEPIQDFAWKPDGSRVFLKFASGLHHVRLDGPKWSYYWLAKAMPVSLGVEPDIIGMRPQGDYLIVAEADRPQFRLFEAEDLAQSLVLDLNVLSAFIATAK
jgi:hypothetical protein